MAIPLKSNVDYFLDPLVLEISPGEHFDYRCIHAFRSLCNKPTKNDVHIHVDLISTRYLDSSGIALLQCLLHWVKSPMVIVRVVNAQPDIRRILQAARLPSTVLID